MFFRLVMDEKISPFMLNTQYRMHPRIAEYISKTFYEGKLLNSDSKVNF